MPRGYTEDEILDEIHRLADDVGRVPSKKDLRQHGQISVTTVEHHFNTWHDALSAAEMTPPQQIEPVPESTMWEEFDHAHVVDADDDSPSTANRLHVDDSGSVLCQSIPFVGRVDLANLPGDNYSWCHNCRRMYARRKAVE